MSSSTSSQSTLPTIASRLVAIRQKLIGRGTYLGHDSVRQNVRWQREGRSDQLFMVKDDLATVAADEGAPGSPSCTGSNDGDEPEIVSPPSSISDGPECASLSAIVKISSQGYYMTADGNYRPGGKVFQHLSAVRPSCICEAPTMEPFKSDFERVMTNLRWLQENMTTPGFTKKQGLFPQLPNTFKVRHILFQKKESDEENSEAVKVDEPEQLTKWTIENWPVDPAGEEELESIKDSHIVQPIPAYDVAGDLISPRSYRVRLEGALVEVEFGLLHWSIAGREIPGGGKSEPSDTYVADLDRIWVISPPTTGLPASPRKRRIPDTIDVNLSPSKRRM